MLELLQGKLSDQVMAVVTDRARGLFPQPREIELRCSCPDWAVMCKHVAAALYGVGSRLDDRPELLFLLRDVDAQDLISAEMTVPGAAPTGDVLDDDQLGDIFGIDLDVAGEETPAPKAKPKKQRRASKHAASTGTRKESHSAVRRKPTPPQSPPKISKKAKRNTAVRKKSVRTAATGRKQARGSASTPPRIRPTGKSVARLRRRLGLSVARFAQQLNVSAASVYRWEATTGRLKLQAHTFATLAELHQKASIR